MLPYLPFFILMGLVLVQSFTNSQAEITLDGSIGGVAKALPGPDYLIEPQDGVLKGNNLFHSFGHFNINHGESATFTGPEQVTSIISRVTGGQSSFIDGPLKSDIPNADLYFLNPNGVIFGFNADLDIKGSFYLSTGDYLRFADGQHFDTHSPSPILSVAKPEAFGFLAHNTGKITIDNSKLETPVDRNLSISGREIEITRYGQLLGRLQLASIATSGEIKPSNVTDNTSSQSSTLIVENGWLRAVREGQAGSVNLSNGTIRMENAVIKAEAGKIKIYNTGKITIDHSSLETPANQNLSISGREIEITRSSQLSGQLQLDSIAADREIKPSNVTDNTSSQASILIVEDGWLVVNGSINLSERAIKMENTFINARAGKIQIMTTGALQFLKNSQIKKNLTGGGDIDIELHGQQVEVSNNALVLNSTSGSIVIKATEQVKVQQGGSVSSEAASHIDIQAPHITISKSGNISNLGKVGKAGNIHLAADYLVLNQGGQINASSVGEQTAGDITIEVTDAVTISGGTTLDINDDDFNSSGISSSAHNSGPGGHIQLTARSLSLDTGGTIQTLTKGEGKAGDIVINVTNLTITSGSDIDASNEGTNQEQGGNITIHAQGLVLITGEPAEPTPAEAKVVKAGFLGGIYSVALENAGTGGDIHLTAGKLILRQGGVISVGSTGTGNAGNLQITVNGALELKNAAIIIRSTQAGGGNIQIQTPARIHLVNSEITAQAQGLKAEHQGGNVTLTNQDFCILNNSLILASAKQGHGGDIRIHSANFIQSPNSTLDAASELGVDGQIEIESQEPHAQFDLVILPSALKEPEELSNRCAVRTRRDLSQFNIINRDVPPTTPADLQTHSIRRPLD
jgi:filamentous hemagglutinin family protein